jgi:hypothetical protein
MKNRPGLARPVFADRLSPIGLPRLAVEEEDAVRKHSNRLPRTMVILRISVKITITRS